jgi:ribonuclease VapC
VSDGEIVVDASAVLALLKSEPLGRLDPDRIVGAWISAVNLSEVLLKLGAGGMPEDAAEQAVSALSLRVVSFDGAHARAAAALWPRTRRAGLSFGDRACLAAAMLLDATALTADRAWARLDVGAKILVAR